VRGWIRGGLWLVLLWGFFLISKLTIESNNGRGKEGDQKDKVELDEMTSPVPRLCILWQILEKEGV